MDDLSARLPAVIDRLANPNDPSRDIDRLDLNESVRFMGRGLRKFRAMEIPNYVEMLGNVCGVLGWNGDSFRGYRCAVKYPFYGCQITMDFTPPPGPAPVPASKS